MCSALFHHSSPKHNSGKDGREIIDGDEGEREGRGGTGGGGREEWRVL